MMPLQYVYKRVWYFKIITTWGIFQKAISLLNLKNKHEGNLYLPPSSSSHYILLVPQIPFCARLPVEMWGPCFQISIFCFELYHPVSCLVVSVVRAQLQEASVFLDGWLDLQMDEGCGHFLLDCCHQSHNWVKYGFDLGPNLTLQI